jgi:hypothetical protein
MAKSKSAFGSVLKDELIVSKIYFIRGQRIMLDADLAELYHETIKKTGKKKY